MATPQKRDVPDNLHPLLRVGCVPDSHTLFDYQKLVHQ
ncbi:hypothetical protein DAD186_14790 [Dermabacter vaginalis]|uniref:Uncharacterized protein n=1 Tax=Dermabacter vaginalis TaxID=1630135 RepID=A0A1B0ZJ70_9MICO|nr:hypothetical protein DAD186_14790 [Dermabacter vaginalis]